MKTDNLIIIQARLSSSRLPGKVLKPLWRGMHLLDLQFQSLKKIDVPFVLATTTNRTDDALVKWANDNKIDTFRGKENNVLHRFVSCAREFDAKNIIRVCSDNPFLQFQEIPRYLREIQGGLDYISYANDAGYPAIRTHWGLFVEGVSLNALERAQDFLLKHPEHRFYTEHVTNFIYGRSDLFKIKLERAPKEVVSRRDLRFTIDTADDFKNMAELIELVGGTQKTLQDVINITNNYPHILGLMSKGIQSYTK